MLDIIIEKIKKILSSRILPLTIIFMLFFSVLIVRVFKMQIVDGAIVAEEDEYKNTVERDIKSTRGMIYDRNGVLLAYNEFKYAVVMSDSAQLTNNAERNEMIYKLIHLLEDYGNELQIEFCIELDENGKLKFNVSDNAELRFKKNAYCLKSVSDLSEEQRNSTAEDVFNFLRYGDSSASMFQISDNYSIEDALKIMAIRYTILIQTKKYTQFTLASNVSNETVVAIKENMAELPGVDVKKQTYRIYNDAIYFAHIIGYTGLINTTELENYNKDGSEIYTSTDYVGKSGIEKHCEDILSGTKGIEQVTVNSAGKVLDGKVVSEPVSGNDIYLSIDRDLQVACYHILERNIAAILISKLNNGFDYGTKGKRASGIKVPIYEVYNALIDNNIIDISHFKKSDATELEKRVLSYFEEKRESILNNLRKLLSIDSKVTNESAGSEMQEYLEYIYQLMQSDTANNLVVRDRVDRNDKMYLDYVNSKISISEYLQYAITMNWIDLDVIIDKNSYYNTAEIYEMMVDYIFELLMDDHDFEEKIYRTLIFSRKLTGREVCLLLFDQNVIEYSEKDYKNLSNGRISAYNFMIEKLTNLEITPGQLALEPCSGSIVINDVNTGEVLAMVTYPSYDNNMLANKIEWDYYSKLLNDNAYPLQNRPTQQVTTTGSTFKPLSSFVGFGEGIINVNTKITDRAEFDLIDPSPRCWKYPSSHGSINVSQAIMHSCNYFYYDIGYRLSLDKNGFYNDAKGIETIKKYASMFGLSEKSGVEVEEAVPAISSRDAVRTMIGYYHSFAPIQIARYISTVASEGTCLDFTLIDHINDYTGKTVYTHDKKVYNEITMFSEEEWKAVKKGMNWVVNTSVNSLNRLYGTIGVTVAGKTGTAQVSTTKPNHALFTSFAPYENPKICVTIVIPNGYSSANAAYIGSEVYNYYFNGENKEALLSGNVKAGTATTISVSD